MLNVHIHIIHLVRILAGLSLKKLVFLLLKNTFYLLKIFFNFFKKYFFEFLKNLRRCVEVKK